MREWVGAAPAAHAFPGVSSQDWPRPARVRGLFCYSAAREGAAAAIALPRTRPNAALVAEKPAALAT